MTDIATSVGLSLLAVSGASSVWIARRWSIAARARRRLHESADHENESPRSAIRRSSATRVTLVHWLPVVIGVVAAAVCAGFGFPTFPSTGVGAIAWILAFIAISSAAKRRALQHEEGLAEAIQLASSALRVGASTVDAFERAARSVKGPAQGLLLELAGRLRLGEDSHTALEALAEQSRLESYRLFAMVLGVQWQAGGSLDRSLLSVSRAVRERVELELRIHTQSASTRVSVFAFVAATALIAYMMWQQNPANLEHFVGSSFGEPLVGASLWLQALGIGWIWRLSQVRI